MNGGEKMNRDDFPMLKHNIVYFDNAATTFKPYSVIKEMNNYYENFTANAHRGDYDISKKVDDLYEECRIKVKDFIHANESREIIFTKGTTESLNMIVFGFMKHYLRENDEVLITKTEHASNVLPWFELADELSLDIDYISLTDNYSVTLDNIKKVIKPNTKVISLAYVTNVIGDIRPIKEIIEYAHKNNILVVIDGAQAVPHMRIDVQELDIDFLAFSAHKMCGPTGVGIMYGKEYLLNDMYPTTFGGGMNASFTFDKVREYKSLPAKLEAGTLNIADIIGFGKVIDYINSIGIDNINEYEKKLHRYAIDKLKEIDNVVIYNDFVNTGIIAFNYKDIHPQDLAIYLDKYNICVRAGNHCAKMLKDELKIKNTVRATLYFYNTKEDIDKLVKALVNPNIKNELL